MPAVHNGPVMSEKNQLYFGDNLDVLQRYVADESVARGYVDEPEHWRYSSARNYAGREGLLDVCKDWQRDMHSHKDRGNEENSGVLTPLAHNAIFHTEATTSR